MPQTRKRERTVFHLIHEMSDNECRAVLARGSIGRLGCALDNQPYVVPIYFAYEPEDM